MKWPSPEVQAFFDSYAQRDPACWSWPAPETCSFKDAETAERFLYYWNNACAICDCAGELIVDHDHQSGFVRGRLCKSCNTLEGNGDGEVYRKYRERNPASILGIKVAYFHPWKGYAGPTHRPDGDERQAAVNRLHLPEPKKLHEESLRDAEPLPQDRMGT